MYNKRKGALAALHWGGVMHDFVKEDIMSNIINPRQLNLK